MKRCALLLLLVVLASGMIISQDTPVEAQERCAVPAEWGELVTVFEGDWGRTPDQWLAVFEDGQGTIRVGRLICAETYRSSAKPVIQR